MPNGRKDRTILITMQIRLLEYLLVNIQEKSYILDLKINIVVFVIKKKLSEIINVF